MLNANNFRGTNVATIRFQAELNRFPSTLHESIKIPCLRMTAGQPWNSGDVIAFFIALNQHREFALAFHERNFTIGSISEFLIACHPEALFAEGSPGDVAVLQAMR
jgi:hypothetical protein